jgi:hypothetical protein
VDAVGRALADPVEVGAGRVTSLGRALAEAGLGVLAYPGGYGALALRSAVAVDKGGAGFREN